MLVKARSCRHLALATTLLLSAILVSSQSPPPTPTLNGTDFNPAYLPTVDLGYEIHRALYFNDTGNFYNFSNIRYAAPPTGTNRFRAPQSPAANRSAVQTGAQGVICPQVQPQWINVAQQFLPTYLSGEPFNLTQADLTALNNSLTPSNIPPQDPRTTEDCLFLDVVVPKPVFDNDDKTKLAPVLIWVYGGGFDAGEKSTNNPSGLIYRSEQGGREPIIFVALNYRLGAFGWLSGPTFQTYGTANNGLLDQRAAFEWVQENIEKFGGDKNRVTVMGESAGGSSIMHHLTAYAGRDTPPFQQAIPQSAAYQSFVSNKQNDDTYAQFLSFANASSFEELQNLPSEQLITANRLQVGHSPYGTFIYGPVVDGTYVPALPDLLLLHGNFNKQVKVMTGKNSDEGILFTDPFIQAEGAFRAILTNVFPTATDPVLDYIEFTLYPPAPYHNGSLNYTDAPGRLSSVIGEGLFQCKSRYIDVAYGALNQSYGYYFAVPPGYHGQDIAFTFYNNNGLDASASVTNTTVAVALQNWITTFTQSGTPSAPDIHGIPNFQLYGPDSQVQDLQQSSITEIMDVNANDRCQWWQKALYL